MASTVRCSDGDEAALWPDLPVCGPVLVYEHTMTQVELQDKYKAVRAPRRQDPGQRLDSLWIYPGDDHILGG